MDEENTKKQVEPTQEKKESIQEKKPSTQETKELTQEKKQKAQKKKDNTPKVMYYSFEISEYDKILELVKEDISESEYSSITEKKIIRITPKKSDQDDLEDAFKNLKVEGNEDEYKDVDECIKNEYNEIEKHLKDKDNGLILITTSNQVYKINEKFHITMLFLKGGEDEIEKKAKIEEKIGDECIIKIKSMAHSDDFITLGVEFGDEVMPYYGNEIKHITIGIRKTTDGKKLFPKDSPSAFTNGLLVEYDTPIEIKGIITKIMNR